jgi:hypothetical protein
MRQSLSLLIRCFVQMFLIKARMFATHVSLEISFGQKTLAADLALVVFVAIHVP